MNIPAINRPEKRGSTEEEKENLHIINTAPRLSRPNLNSLVITSRHKKLPFRTITNRSNGVFMIRYPRFINQKNRTITSAVNSKQPINKRERNSTGPQWQVQFDFNFKLN